MLANFNLKSIRGRAGFVLIGISVLITGHLGMSFLFSRIESNNIRRHMEMIKSDSRTINILENKHSKRYRFENNTLTVKRNNGIQVFLAIIDNKSGRVIFAATENDKVLHWQVDWRFLESDYLGKNYFIMHVPNNMYRKEYQVKIACDHAEILGFFLLDLQEGDHWGELLYNDVFYDDNGIIQPKLSTGYGVSKRQPEMVFRYEK